MSRRRKNRSIPQSRPARKIENLRNDTFVARRSWQRERRQFVPYDLPPTKVRFPSDFRTRAQETYTLVDGRPAHVGQEMPRNVNNGDLRKSNLQTALHDYFQEPSKFVSVCQRRAMRRRVLFALRRTGKGARSRKREWTEESKVRCV